MTASDQLVKPAGTAPPPRHKRLFLVALSLLATALFLALGIWQVERRAWKLDLIARVEARLASSPVPAPGRAAWLTMSRDADEYRRVTARGRLLPDRAVRTLAVTEKGAGSWLLVPLVTEAGDTILVNRGFVPADWQPPPGDGEGSVTVTGLLRIPEPGGGFLRSNDPAHDRWYSRDVAAIADAKGLGPVAPYFIDADASGNRPGAPVGGLTVVAFRNHHLIYALTWFGLAALSGYAAYRALRER
ncbi:surfeit locus 1 family protein [Methylobacterium sp. 174MFSha1.1]|uniref:SURF1 family protein n=1 Tax=Methylobacterium sp. 174MFSha1.1 TaxID=1502749 RepID=UPI0008E832A7|nr:SURF1 family protein [Methylobacterium sp. 174MFSha1.1]SFU97203.1 surfeit locus 1 family protein [Methylobacterium sp. 174MFSha1.1]